MAENVPAAPNRKGSKRAFSSVSSTPDKVTGPKTKRQTIKPSKKLNFTQPDKQTPTTSSTVTKMAGRGNKKGKDNLMVIDPAGFADLYDEVLQMPKIKKSLGVIIDDKILTLKNDVKTLKQSTDAKFEQIDLKNDAIEQSRRCRTLRFAKFDDSPMSNAENDVISIAAALNIDISPHEIDRAFRVGKYEIGKTRPILAEFTRLKLCRELMANRGGLKADELKNSPFASVFINEDLTPARANIGYIARQMVSQGYILSTWPGGGEIFIRQTPESKPVKIKSKKHLESLKLLVPLSQEVRDEYWKKRQETRGAAGGDQSSKSVEMQDPPSHEDDNSDDDSK